jgi:hypothetical protein
MRNTTAALVTGVLRYSATTAGPDKADGESWTSVAFGMGALMVVSIVVGIMSYRDRNARIAQDSLRTRLYANNGGVPTIPYEEQQEGSASRHFPVAVVAGQ